MRGRLGGADDLALVADHQAPVQVLLHLNPGMGVAAALEIGQELEGPPTQTHGVVPSHGARVLETQHTSQVQAREGRW